jgi:hypothetical protein
LPCEASLLQRRDRKLHDLFGPSAALHRAIGRDPFFVAEVATSVKAWRSRAAPWFGRVRNGDRDL